MERQKHGAREKGKMEEIKRVVKALDLRLEENKSAVIFGAHAIAGPAKGAAERKSGLVNVTLLDCFRSSEYALYGAVRCLGKAEETEKMQRISKAPPRKISHKTTPSLLVSATYHAIAVEAKVSRVLH